MSSEKPFWEGKTCEEMANLHVKVTFVAGAVLTGITDCSGHIRRSRNGSVVPISANRGAERFVPYRDIESIELLDDPEYERIDNIEDVREGDIFVANDGNKYLIANVDTNRAFECCRVYLSYAPAFELSNVVFAYALRPKPKLPDEPGLWFDKYDAVWCFDGDSLRPLRGAITGEWDIYEDTWGISATTLFAPFRPAKAVEA